MIPKHQFGRLYGFGVIKYICIYILHLEYDTTKLLDASLRIFPTYVLTFRATLSARIKNLRPMHQKEIPMQFRRMLLRWRERGTLARTCRRGRRPLPTARQIVLWVNLVLSRSVAMLVHQKLCIWALRISNWRIISIAYVEDVALCDGDWNFVKNWIFSFADRW